MAAIARPSAIIPSASVVVALTSPLIGPSTIDAISAMTSSKTRPSFAIKDGFVVTPQITPMSFAFLISSTFAVSIKNFIDLSLLVFIINFLSSYYIINNTINRLACLSGSLLKISIIVLLKAGYNTGAILFLRHSDRD